METLKIRAGESGLKIAYNPPGDGLCFYSAAGHQLGLPALAVRKMIFQYLKSNQYDVRLLVNFVYVACNSVKMLL